MNYLAIALIVFSSIFGAVFGNSQVILKVLDSMNRQPEMKNDFKMIMFVGVALIEAIPILGIVIALLILFK